MCLSIPLLLYILIFLHQTATLFLWTRLSLRCISLYSYIKPQPWPFITAMGTCCISLYSYIKPQHISLNVFKKYVVYPYIPTSNRNSLGLFITEIFVVYPYIPTSNRNKTFGFFMCCTNFRYGVKAKAVRQ